MLFIDDDHTKALKLHLVIQNGVSADQYGYLSFGDALKEGLSIPALDGTRKQCGLQVKMLEQAAQRGKVLLCEEFRRGHEGHLQAIGHGHQHCDQGNNGLTASHVTLYEAIHWERMLHVSQNLFQYPLLGSGQSKWQAAQQRFAKMIRAVVMLYSFGNAGLAVADCKTQFKQKKLFKSQTGVIIGLSFSQLAKVCLDVREVHFLKCPPQQG